MRWFKIILPLVFLFYASTVSADFYKYVDEKGNVHFTDDFNKVPADQREQAQGYEEYRPERPAAVPQARSDPSGNPESDQALSSKTPDEAQTDDFDHQLKMLDQRKAELASEYEALVKENTDLNDIKKTVKNRADADQYNESVRKLNEKLQEHDRKRKEFFSDVEDYNARVGQANKTGPKSTAP
ncbi:MAG: DUF4124 domain-containing protein [Deltaproteobacteria bacterium]|jgi:hypothetical protein|nr:MAG: DUF4124 domain-containing protein [Deltaproteobacteria bacterium]